MLIGCVSVTSELFKCLHDNQRVNGAIEPSVFPCLELVEEKHQLRGLEVMILLRYDDRTLFECVSSQLLLATTEL